MNLEGMLVDGFVVLEHAARGHFGEVLKVQEKATGKIRALKILDEEDENEALPDAFRHEGIIKYYQKGHVHGKQYHILEWIDGQTLAEIPPLRQDPQKCIDYMLQICNAVAHMHAHGYLHNDIKRNNIMLNTTETGERITLLDYSLATKKEDKKVDTKKIPSREIRAPEIIEKKEVSEKTDQWSTAVLMYQLLTGEHPFPHTEKDEIAGIVADKKSYRGLKKRIKQKVPKQFQKVITRALEYDPKRRYTSINEMKQDITRGKSNGAFYAGCISLMSIPLLCTGMVFGYRCAVPEPNPNAFHIVDVYRREVDRPQRIKAHDDKYAVCNGTEHDTETKKRECQDFRDAEEAIDKTDFVRAAFLLEEIIKQDPNNEQAQAALIEAYIELRFAREGQQLIDAFNKRFPESTAQEVRAYSEILPVLLRRFPVSVTLSDDICDLAMIRQNYPECKAAAAVETLGSDREKEDAWNKIRGKYPHSFIAERETARLLAQEALKKEMKKGRMQTHLDLETVNEALQHYQRVAEITEESGAGFFEIGTTFLDTYKDQEHAFVYLYRAAEEGYPILENSMYRPEAVLFNITSKQQLVHAIQYKKGEELIIKDNPKTWCFDEKNCKYIVDMDREYTKRSLACTKGPFEVASCSK